MPEFFSPLIIHFRMAGETDILRRAAQLGLLSHCGKGMTHIALALRKGRMRPRAYEPLDGRGMRIMTTGTVQQVDCLGGMNRDELLLLGIVAGKAELLLLGDQQAFKFRVMNCMANCALVLAKRLMKKLVFHPLLKILVAHETEGDCLRRSDQGLFVRGVRIMAGEAPALLHRRMN
jgi:hypothetical protein